ncbi:MAG: hypothetical protein ACXWT3_03175 [Methylococcaceae bacterium]
MHDYQKSKKARYIASVVYLIILGGILTGTYFSEQQKAKTETQAQQSAVR